MKFRPMHSSLTVLLCLCDPPSHLQVILIHLSNLTGLKNNYSKRTMMLLMSDLGTIVMGITAALSASPVKVTKHMLTMHPATRHTTAVPAVIIARSDPRAAPVQAMTAPAKVCICSICANCTSRPYACHADLSHWHCHHADCPLSYKHLNKKLVPMYDPCLSLFLHQIIFFCIGVCYGCNTWFHAAKVGSQCRSCMRIQVLRSQLSARASAVCQYG